MSTKLLPRSREIEKNKSCVYKIIFSQFAKHILIIRENCEMQHLLEKIEIILVDILDWPTEKDIWLRNFVQINILKIKRYTYFTMYINIKFPMLIIMLKMIG